MIGLCFTGEYLSHRPDHLNSPAHQLSAILLPRHTTIAPRIQHTPLLVNMSQASSQDDNTIENDSTTTTIHTRAYQQELLDESLQRNIIIALDTGSGKTHIAVLRIKHEVERSTRKVCSVPEVVAK